MQMANHQNRDPGAVMPLFFLFQYIKFFPTWKLFKLQDMFRCASHLRQLQTDLKKLSEFRQTKEPCIINKDSTIVDGEKNVDRNKASKKRIKTWCKLGRFYPNHFVTEKAVRHRNLFKFCKFKFQHLFKNAF